MPSPGLSGLGGPCPPPLSLCSSSPGPCPGAAVCWACSQPRALPPATRRDCALGACPPPWALEPRARAAPGAAHGAPCAQEPCTQQGWALPHSSRCCLQGFVPALGFLIKPRARRVPVPLLLLPVPGTPSAPPSHQCKAALPQPGCGSVSPPPGALPLSHLAPLQLLPLLSSSSCPVACHGLALCCGAAPPAQPPCVTLGKPNTGAGGAAFPGRARWMCFVSQSLQALAAIDGLGLARGL